MEKFAILVTYFLFQSQWQAGLAMRFQALVQVLPFLFV